MNSDCCCTLSEEQELYEEILVTFSRQRFKNLKFHLVSSDIFIIQNLVTEMK
jgi:hypothetical protein